MNLEERIARLERQNRRLVRLMAITVMVMLSISLVAASQLGGITVRTCEVRDQAGKRTIVLQENGDAEISGNLKVGGNLQIQGKLAAADLGVQGGLTAGKLSAQQLYLVDADGNMLAALIQRNGCSRLELISPQTKQAHFVAEVEPGGVSAIFSYLKGIPHRSGVPSMEFCGFTNSPGWGFPRPEGGFIVRDINANITRFGLGLP